MTSDRPDLPGTNTVALLGRVYSLLGFTIVDGVVAAGYPQRAAHSAVFAQIEPDGSRLTDLARRAGMTPQAVGELLDDLEQLEKDIDDALGEPGHRELRTLLLKLRDSS